LDAVLFVRDHDIKGMVRRKEGGASSTPTGLALQFVVVVAARLKSEGKRTYIIVVTLGHVLACRKKHQ
jgi:hypothetical protein